MTKRDLGMQRSITRRDFIGGAAVAISGSLAWRFSEAETPTSGYPPGLTGLRGSHVGSFEVAHQLAREGRHDWGSVNEPDELYDLVVVGAGVSGLSAAFFYRQAHPDARILILDNHDDFGGHAKRNEFEVGNRTLVTHGGSELLEEPESYSEVAKGLFHDLGIQPRDLGEAYDFDFYRRNGLTAGTYFDRETFGVDRTLAHSFVDSNHYEGWISVAESRLSHEEAVSQVPISDAAKQEMLHLLTTRENTLTEHDYPSDEDYLNSISYREFLDHHVKIREPEVYTVLENLATDWCVGIEAVPAIEAFYWGLPGINATPLGGESPWFGGGSQKTPTYHFPDGNASVARMLVRKMIPDVAPGSTIEDLVTARFDYSKLDVADSKVRIRLRSTAVHVEHDGDPQSASRVGITYVQGGQASRLKARHCVLACYNQIIPDLCPELPAPQREALKTMVKSPIIYTNVALRNWQAWKKLGIGTLLSPGSYYVTSLLEYPVDFGEHRYPRDPDEPTVVHMTRFPHRSNEGLTPSQQKVAGRHELFATSFETIERNTRRQLAGSLSAGGFDPARDILGITVNRWAHAYINRANPLFDEIYEDRDDERYPFVRGRKPFGRIAIANSDAGSSSLLNIAIDQAYRAVTELT